jgi:hypothetical protein
MDNSIDRTLTERNYINKMNTIEKVTASIVANYVANHYNNEVKHTPVYNGKLKVAFKPVMIQLEKIERNYYDQLDDNEISSNALEYTSQNLINFIQDIVQFPFTEATIIQKILTAFRVDPKRIEGIADKIIKDFAKNDEEIQRQSKKES